MGLWMLFIGCEPGPALVSGNKWQDTAGVNEDTASVNDDGNVDASVDADGDGYSLAEDCDDDNAAIHPNAEEICDARDNDCDAEIDEEDICPCEYASFEGKGYFFCEEPMDWNDAKAACEETREEYQLVTINDESENLWIHELEIVAAAENRWWIGLNDLEEEGEFAWVSGEEVSYTSWHDGEPNDSGGEDCTELKRFSSTNWNDVPCDVENLFVCEGPR